MAENRPASRHPHPWSVPDNFLALAQGASFAEARFALLPVPFDSTASFRGGARDGPLAIIEASKQVELYDPEMEREVSPRICTLEPLEPARGSCEENCRRVSDTVAWLLKAGKVPVILGGDHSVSIGAMSCFPKDVLVIALDAHGDLRDEYEGSKFDHACVMRHALSSGKEVVEVGVRAISSEEAKLEKEEGEKSLLMISAERAHEDFEWTIKAVAAKAKGRKVYLTIDIDCFDPSEAPGTGTPEPGGLYYSEGLAIVKAVCSGAKEIVALDVVEVSPTCADKRTEFLAAKLIFKILGYLEK